MYSSYYLGHRLDEDYHPSEALQPNMIARVAPIWCVRGPNIVFITYCSWNKPYFGHKCEDGRPPNQISQCSPGKWVIAISERSLQVTRYR